MDTNFHMDDFERLLREKSDEFRMYPSKRIWHSIYNNIHPGRKWPSVAMCITLISALLLVGYLNTRNTNSYTGINKTDSYIQTVNFSESKSSQLVASPTNSAITTSTLSILAENAPDNNPGLKVNQPIKNSTAANLPIIQTLPFNRRATKLANAKNLPVIDKSGSQDLLALNPDDSDIKSDFKLNNYTSSNRNYTKNESQLNLYPITETGLEEMKNESQFGNGIVDELEEEQLNDAIVINFSNYPANNPEVGKIATVQVKEIVSQVEKLKFVSNKNEIVSTEDKNWMDNYALYNKPGPKKWANKLEWQMYATPSVVYRTLNSSTAFATTLNAATPFAISSSSQNINATVIQKPSVGFELGSGLQYLILKNVKIKGSLQLNFTRYNAHAFENSHPVATKLTMHNFETKTAYEVYRSTAYSNNSGLGSVILHNETFQVSLPVGADLKLIGNERLQWNVGATIQPTFVAGGKSYLISSDRHNYVKETSMLNRWNLNAGFETFVSFKSNGLTWQVGPQFRKQLFSTNSKTFAVEEKLVNYGIKFGVSKTLK